MELIELAISNFKRFTDERIGFCAGLNLLWGPNESGKSTVHEAICCALFGRERGKTVENWNGGACLAELTYRSNGRSYRIERRLTEGVSKLGVPKGDELTDVVTDKDEIAALIADHLGVSSRAVFDNTVSVRQMNLSKPGSSEMEAVGGEIQRVLTGTAHVSADEVLKRLEADRDAITGRARPTNPREYDRISDRLAKLAEELADARSSRLQIQNLDEERAELEVRIERDSERLGTMGGLLERHKRWSELTQKQAEVNALHESVYNTLRKIKDTIADLGLVHKELERHTDLVGKDDEIAEHLSKIAGKREEAEARLAESEAAGRGSPSGSGRSASIAFLTAAVALALVGAGALVLLGPKAAWIAYSALGAAAASLIIRYIRAGAGGPAAELKRLAESSQADLNRLDVEEKSILTYVKCPDTGRAWAKIKNYRNQASRAREFEVGLKALLGGRKLEDWEAQDADLARELSNTSRELEGDFAGYSPSTEEAESWRSEFAALQGSLPPAQARLNEVRGSLDTERKNARDLAALEGELEYLHKRKGELDFTYKAYEEAISAVQSVTQTVSAEFLPDLSKQASAHLARLTSGRYTSVRVSPGWEITADCADRSEVRPAALSIGTLDQLYFALRLGCGALLSAGRTLPLMLDDPFASFDRQRLDNALSLLKVIARENQILLMTHDPYILDWAREVSSDDDVPCAIRELTAPEYQSP
jgi:DNA repair exonuclease SbcCD ATPase subunit